MSHAEIYPSADGVLSTFVGRAIVEPNPNAGEFEYDQQLIDAVELALRAIGRAALRGLVVEACRDAVVLHGRVPSYYEKQLAQATARQVVRGRQVVNEIEVVCCR